MVEARSTDASNLFLHLQMLIQHNTQIVHRRQLLYDTILMLLLLLLLLLKLRSTPRFETDI